MALRPVALNPIVALPVTGLATYVNSHDASLPTVETVPESPNSAWRVVISTDATTWFRVGGTAAFPSGHIVDGTGSFMIGAGVSRIFDCAPGDEISIIGPANVSFEYFAS